MPLMKRYLAKILDVAPRAAVFSLLPRQTWAENAPAVSGSLSYGQLFWSGVALAIVVVCIRVLMAKYRHRRGRLSTAEEPVGQNDAFREMLRVSPDAILICRDH